MKRAISLATLVALLCLSPGVAAARGLDIYVAPGGSDTAAEIGSHNTLLDPARPEESCLEIRACARILHDAGLERRWRYLLSS